MTGPDDARPNFFLLLGLDPAAPWDEALFHRELSRHEASWTRVAGGDGGPASEAGARLSLREQIDRVMRDPELREAERERAAQAEEAARNAQRAAVSNRLDVLLARGFLLEGEVAKLRADFAEVLDAHPDLGRRLAGAPVRQALSELPEALEPSHEEELRRHLDGVRAQSLYEVLREVDATVTHTSPREVLLRAAVALGDRAGASQDGRHPKARHWARLSILAGSVFESDDSRRRHDVSMWQARLQLLLADFEATLSVAAEVSAAQVELFLRRARESGVEDLDQARVQLVEHFRALRWPVQLPAEETQRQLTRLLQCVYCHELNEPHERACRTCGEDLDIPCPSCGQVEPRYGGGCRCGFPIGQRVRAESLLRKARSALDAHDLAGAESELDRVERLWHLPPDRADDLAARISATRRHLTETRDRATEEAAVVNLLIRQRKFVTAVQRLGAAPGGLPRREQLLAQAERAVERAQELHRQAQQPGRTSAARVRLYTEALQVCDDFAPARAALRGIPPAPPVRVRAKVEDLADGVRLDWQPSPDPDVSYEVYRGTGNQAPRYAEERSEQRRIGTTNGTTWRDGTAVEMPGRTLWYAVFTERHGAYSTAATADSVIVPAAATDVRAAAENGRVVLSAQVSERAARIEVRRTALDNGEERLVPFERGEGRAVDTDVRTGVRYRYTVSVSYRDDAGTEWWSPEVTCEVTPIERPVSLDPPTATALPTVTGMYRHLVQLRWPVEVGAVRIVRQPGAGQLREGDVVPEDKLGRGGRVLSGGPPVDDVWIDATLDLCSYFPVLLLEGSGYVGRARRYARASEPGDVEGAYDGAMVRLGWRWPDEVVAALVGYDPAGMPVDPTTAPGQRVVDRVGRGTYGGVELPVDVDELHVRVATVVRRHGLDFVTSGVPVRVRRPAVRVGYVVRTTRRHRELVLRAGQRVPLPGLVLVAGAGRDPYTRADGRTVLVVPPHQTVDGDRVIPLPRDSEREPYYRLFTDTAGDRMPVELVWLPTVGY